MKKKKQDLLNNVVPLFKDWSGWYWLIIAVNLAFIVGFYLYFKAL